MDACMPMDDRPAPAASSTRSSSDAAADAAASLDESGRDLVLLDAFRRSGDRDAMDRLLSRHDADAYRLARRLTGNAADAEDDLQEACICCMAHAKSFRGDGAVRLWVLAIVANAARHHPHHHHSTSSCLTSPARLAGMAS